MGFHKSLEINRLGCREKGFIGLRLSRHRQEIKNSAPLVVQQDHEQPVPVGTCSKEPVSVMKKGQIAGHEDTSPAASRGHAAGQRKGPVNPVGTSLAERDQGLFPAGHEPVRVPHGKAAGKDHRGPRRQHAPQQAMDIPLKESMGLPQVLGQPLFKITVPASPGNRESPGPGRNGHRLQEGLQRGIHSFDSTLKGIQTTNSVPGLIPAQVNLPKTLPQDFARRGLTPENDRFRFQVLPGSVITQHAVVMYDHRHRPAGPVTKRIGTVGQKGDPMFATEVQKGLLFRQGVPPRSWSCQHKGPFRKNPRSRNNACGRANRLKGREQCLDPFPRGVLHIALEGKKRLAKGAIQVDRAVWLPQRGLKGGPTDFPHLAGKEGIRFRKGQLGVKTGRASEELCLVDRLPGMAVPEFRRTIGGENQQRQGRLPGLDDGRIIMRRRRTRGTDKGHRPPGRLDPPEGMEGCRTLIETDRVTRITEFARGKGQRCRARSRRNHEMVHPQPPQGLDNKDAEGKVCRSGLSRDSGCH